AQFSARLFDQAGNHADGNISSTALDIDLEVNDPILVSLVSNNTFPYLAKTGDILTISINYDENVDTPGVTVDDNVSTISSLGSNQFQASYELLGTEPEGEINSIESSAIDYLGNSGIYEGAIIGEGATNVKYDRTIPILNQVTIASSNEHTQWAKVGDRVTINIIGSEVLLSKEATIQAQIATVSNLTTTESNLFYDFLDTDTEGSVAFAIIFSDSAGNEGVQVDNTTDGSWVVFDKTPPAEFSTGAVLAIGGNEIEDFWNSTNTSMKISVPIAGDDTTITNGKIQIMGKIGSNSWENVGNPFLINEADLGSDKFLFITASEVELITGFENTDTISFKANISDRPGNMTEGSISSDRIVIDQTLPTINYVSYKSNFSDTTLATTGHEITLKIKIDENIEIPAMTISNQDAEIFDLGNNIWIGKHIMEESSSEGAISFQVTQIQDVAGNPTDGTNVTTDGSIVIFDSRPPILNNVRIKSDNSDSTWAKVGDSIIVNFKTNEYLIQQSATILNQDADLSILSEGYRAKYFTTQIDTEGSVNFELTIIDTLGLSNIISETTNSSNVIFDKTPPILGEVNIQSNNENNPSIAIAGDDVILSFTPEEPILIDSIIVTIANEIINVSENNGSYTAILTLSGEEPGGILPFTIDFMDRASNRGTQVASTTDDTYVNHDIVPPELLSISIYSNNQDTTWAKIDDTVFVKFTANEALDNFNIIIAGNNSDYIDDGVAKYRAFHIMDIDDYEGDINFSIDYTDLGGATGPTGGSTTDGTIVRYDRTNPELSSIRMSTNNSTGDSAGIGDMDSLFFVASEANRSVSIIVADSNIASIQDGFEFSAVREMQEEDQDGLIDFSIVLDDSAGNSTGQVSETNDGSFVWFDGTRPLLNQVSFNSTNIGDSSLAISGDTLILDFVSSEDLGDIAVSIAGFNADTIFFKDIQSSYQSWYVLQGIEEEGYVPFQITYADLVGNHGDTVNSTTDDTSILFDVTPPQDFQLDTLYVSGGNIVEGYWNASNDSIIIRFPIAIDDESLIGGSFQPQVKFGEEEYINLGNEIEIIDISDNGYELLKIARDLFELASGYSEDINSQFTTKIIDKAGNETLGTSNGSLLHIDEIIPIIDSVSIKTNNTFSDNWATISDSIILVINSNEGLDIITANLGSNAMTVIGSTNGTEQNCTYVVDILDSEGTVSFSIEYADTAGNIGLPITETTNGEIVGIDNNKPIINGLMEGENNLDPNYYNRSDSITIYWTHNDTTSGIREVYFSLGSIPNSSNVAPWTNGGVNDYGGWNNLNLENNTMYYGAAFVVDSAGNNSDTIWGNGVYIDNEIPIAGVINDGQWILEMDYTPDSTSLEYSWEGFSDNVGIDHFELSIGTDTDTFNIQYWYQTENIENVIISNLELDRDIQYLTYMRAVDSANNFSEIIRTDGIYFDDSEPRVMKITPDFGDSSKVLSILDNDTIKIKFNRLIYFYDIKIESSADSNLVTEEFYADSLITITWDDTLTSNDTLIVYLDSALAFNSLFITDTLYFYSHLWGDLNNDYDLTVEDILQFNRLWPEIDIGPFMGSPPHIRPMPDAKANLIDLSSFAKIWQWRYFDLSLDTSFNISRVDNGQFISAEGSQINISVPKKTFMAEIMVGNSNLDVEGMRIMQPTNNTFLFKSIDTLNKIIQFSLADYKGLDSNLTMVVPIDHSNSLSATIQYCFLDDFGNIILSGLNDYDIDLLPDHFLVYANYPNPFNPKTTIRYDLPNQRDIQIKIIDVMGRTIKSLKINDMTPGRKSYVWDGTNDFGNVISTGIYFFQIIAGNDSKIMKMLFLK
ncbi:MAG: FlgD immunoglobulin-like domain containing protein, partial [Candidatus Neomarinimicrobiota bacterium]